MKMNMQEIFTTSLFQVLVMLAYGLPGFLLVKLKKIKQTHIISFNHILMFLCQPLMVIYAFKISHYEKGMNANLFVFGVVTFFIQVVVILGIYLIFRKKAKEQAKYRILSVATAFGNVGFFGIPLVQVILPDNKVAVLYAVIYLLGMNIIAWTLASAILTNNRKHMSIVKFLFNPTTLPLIIALPMFYTNTEYPKIIGNGIDIMGKMATVVSMLILGMRLAVTPNKELFKTPTVWVTVVLKQMIFPLFVLLIAFSLKNFLKEGALIMFVLSCAPCASIVLNFSEHHNQGAEIAAPTVLMSTMTSFLTIPLMLLIVPSVFGNML